MHVAESLHVGSVPAFLLPEEIDELRRVLVSTYAGAPTLAASARQDSVHSIEGLSTEAAMRVYEPKGRDELSTLPEAARKVLDAAAERLLPTVRIMLPSVRELGYWTFVSYTEGQFITPHIDLSDNDPDADHPKVAGISICLSDPADYTGGEFFVETACDAAQWLPSRRGPVVRPECDHSSSWFRAQPRTRWHVRPRQGEALLYGSQLTHGTEPVRSGRVNKIIGFLVS
ncbi:hypothetical protein GCM10022243_58000 [Saccharothrix violaceirubra]|uniref:Prolyl 4-hydroxylase alpha subunit Fe(2+) 2OG dioxygenase domain-containing protein n=1 Tax=Saccharothrix violaceirubra TaxID=413306 RepID=A0A7W7T3B6_9PSEU|nr:2OG-Fe(II) oxygenase [Saccharothrix violaceirubra]MBB4965769.1 hypothetical protein [Saccharothrix violaceirubra]